MFRRLLDRFRPHPSPAVAGPLADPAAWLRGGRAAVTGTLAVGAVVAGRLVRRARAAGADGALPESLPLAVDAATGAFEIAGAQARYYVRAGVGVPVVVLPGVTPVSSCVEVAPLFEHLARTTARPVYALDWLGFGRSDRPDLRYQSGLYQRQLRRFLALVVGEPADVVAGALGAEYAAAVAVAAPALVRRLVLVAPSGMESGSEGSLVGRVLVGLTGGTGAFALFFRSRLARRDAIRRYYAENVFTTGAPVPDALVDYADAAAHADGADHAPRRYAEGLLYMDEYAHRSYASLAVPTLAILPALTDRVAPHFDALPSIARHNDRLVVTKLDTGLLPQWEQPDALFALLDTFLTGSDVPRYAPVDRPTRRALRAARATQTAGGAAEPDAKKAKRGAR